MKASVASFLFLRLLFDDSFKMRVSSHIFYNRSKTAYSEKEYLALILHACFPLVPEWHLLFYTSWNATYYTCTSQFLSRMGLSV